MPLRKRIPMCHRLAAIVIILLLTGCAGGEAGMAEPRCRAAGAEAELGKNVDDNVADNARAAAGAMRARIVRPGQVATLSDPQRLNIEIDETGKIRKLSCG